MSIALVQHKLVKGTSAAPSGAFTNPTTPGNLVIATAWWDSTSKTLGGLTDPAAHAMNARALLKNIGSPFYSLQNFWLPNVAAGSAAVAGTLSGSADWVLFLSEWSGALVSGALDSGNTSTDAHGNGTGTSALSASITPSVPNCLIYGIAGNESFSSTTIAGGFTAIDTDTSNTAFVNGYLVQTAAAAAQMAATITTSRAWDAFALIFQPAAGGGTAVASQINARLKGSPLVNRRLGA